MCESYTQSPFQHHIYYFHVYCNGLYTMQGIYTNIFYDGQKFRHHHGEEFM